MKNKILFAVMAATVLLSIFSGLKFASAFTEGMALNPTEKIVDPPYGSQGWFFLWELNISTSTQVNAWEAVLYWDPAVLRISLETPVVFGDFMSGASVENYSERIGEGSIRLGQYFTESYTVTGSGTLAYLNFTFRIPGATEVKFLEAVVWDDDLNPTDLLPGSADGRIKSNRPHPEFTWSTADGLNPLPNHTIFDGGDEIQHYDVVTFNASASYDVSNLVWDGSAWVPDGGYPDIVYYRWEFGDGEVAEGAGLVTVTHVYQGYNYEGWLVNLTVWDSENDYWSTTWRYGGPDPANTVPMWRDVAVVDIWISCPPYEYWQEYGLDWWVWWWLDTQDYWIPNLNDPYWDYPLPPSYCSDFGLPENTTVRDFGAYLWIVLTANNYGSVAEKVTVKLYAVYMKQKVDIGAGGAWVPEMDEDVELIDEWTITMNAESGSGWSLLTLWTPPQDGFYVLFATIESAYGSVMEDQDPSNNYFMMPETFTTTAAWDFTSLSLVKEQSFTRYLVDFTGDGVVNPREFAILGNRFIFGKRWTQP